MYRTGLYYEGVTSEGIPDYVGHQIKIVRQRET